LARYLPDLKFAPSPGLEVNPLSIVRPSEQSFAEGTGGELPWHPTFGLDDVDIVLASTIGLESDLLAVRRPARKADEGTPKGGQLDWSRAVALTCPEFSVA